MLEVLRRWSMWAMIVPSRFVDPDGDWLDGFDFEMWSRVDYEWVQDDWNGFRDVATPPAETVEKAEGDCEDYALVAASWALSEGYDTVGLAVCWSGIVPIPEHMIAYTDEAVFSSGSIHHRSIDGYLDRSEYDRAFRREL